jgi:hypothetical protein
MAKELGLKDFEARMKSKEKKIETIKSFIANKKNNEHLR